MAEPSKMEDELDAALAALDQEAPLPTTTLRDPASASNQTTGERRRERPTRLPGASQTLDALDDARRPKAGTVCERCPNSVWFASADELKCYCRVMFLITWSTREPNQLTHCDGEFLGQE